MGNIIQKAQSRKAGETKVDSKGRTLIWTEVKSGSFDWRMDKSSITSVDKDNKTKAQKLREHLADTPVEKLRTFATKKENDPNLRIFAVRELEKRGEDVSDIDLNNGKLGAIRKLTGKEEDADVTERPRRPAPVSSDEDESDANDWRNIPAIKTKFNNAKTKKDRIDMDNYIYNLKIKDPKYKDPKTEIQLLNRTYAQFLMTDSPFMIAAGGAGVGKSFNFHEIAREIGKVPYDPDIHGSNAEEDEDEYVADDSYDYIEAPEVNSIPKFAAILKQHNGKTIVFDDSDEVVNNAEIAGMLKKATASSGKRIIGNKSTNKSSNVDPFEFTGKILLITNKNQSDFTKNEHMNAIYSRALKKDIYFTKEEQLQFIEKLRHKMNFTGVDRLENKADDIRERNEVFKILEENVGKMDPAKFSSRIFKEALEIKRSNDLAAQLVEDNPMMEELLGNAGDWKEQVEDFLIKGILPEAPMTFQKALDILDLSK